MKLKPVEAKAQPTYPSIDEHRQRRQTTRIRAAIAVGAVMGLPLLSGCPKIQGMMGSRPAPPEVPSTHETVRDG